MALTTPSRTWSRSSPPFFGEKRGTRALFDVQRLVTAPQLIEEFATIPGTANAGSTRARGARPPAGADYMPRLITSATARIVRHPGRLLELHYQRVGKQHRTGGSRHLPAGSSLRRGRADLLGTGLELVRERCRPPLHFSSATRTWPGRSGRRLPAWTSTLRARWSRLVADSLERLRRPAEEGVAYLLGLVCGGGSFGDGGFHEFEIRILQR